MSLLLLLYHAVNITKFRTHSADVNKRKTGNVRLHTTDVQKRTRLLGVTRTHTTDTYKSRRFTRSHSTDTYLTRKSFISHTTDVYKTVGSTTATPAFVQAGTTGAGFGTLTSTLSVTAGNGLFVAISTNGSTGAPTDSQGNTYTLLAVTTQVKLYGAIAGASGSNTASVVISSGNTNIIFSEYSGVSLTLDITAITATGGNSAPSTTGTTVTDNDLIISIGAAQNSWSTGAGTGYSHLQSSVSQSGVPLFQEDLVKTPAGGITPSFSGSSFFTWYMLVVALKPGSTSSTRTFAQRHTTDVAKVNRGTKTHSADMFKRGQGVRSHSTDTFLRYRANYTRQNNATLPTTNTDLTTPFTNADYTVVAANDSTYVGQTGSNYNIFEFKYTHTSNNQAITATWDGQSTVAPTVRPVTLQIWNYNTSAWETLQTNSTTGANTDFALTGTKSSPANYYDSNNIVIARVYQ